MTRNTKTNTKTNVKNIFMKKKRPSTSKTVAANTTKSAVKT